jgi:fatty acid desaturase
MGHNPWTVVPVAVACVLQTAIAAAVGVYDVSWLWTCILGYLISPFLAGNLMAAHHEISHFLVFKKPFWNRVLMVAANAPLGIPLGSLFKQYHQDHHSHMVSTAGASRVGMQIQAEVDRRARKHSCVVCRIRTPPRCQPDLHVCTLFPASILPRLPACLPASLSS